MVAVVGVGVCFWYGCHVCVRVCKSGRMCCVFAGLWMGLVVGCMIGFEFVWYLNVCLCWCRCSANDIGSELQAIFAGDFNTNQASVFGCSPPQRATNPLSRDCQFHRVVLVNPNVADRKVSKDSFANRMSGV